MKREWFRRHWWHLLIGGAGLWAGIILVNEENWLCISALATLVLAFAAFLTIKGADAREQRHRNNELLKEERARKERRLNEIIEWAEDVARLNFKIYNFVEAQIFKEVGVESSIGEIVSQFQVIETKGVLINSVAISSFKEDKKLNKAVKAINKEIRKLADTSIERLDGKITSEEVTKHVNLLRLKIADLFKEAAKILTGM